MQSHMLPPVADQNVLEPIVARVFVDVVSALQFRERTSNVDRGEHARVGGLLPLAVLVAPADVLALSALDPGDGFDADHAANSIASGSTP
jgi:hypothetical protein